MNCCGWPGRWRPRPSIPWPRDRRRRPGLLGGSASRRRVRQRPGLGVAAWWTGHAVVAGRAGLAGAAVGVADPGFPHRPAAAAEAAGRTAMFAGWDGQVRGLLVVADTVKPTSAAAVARLRGLGLRPVLLTGDNDRAARDAAAAVGIGEVIAGRAASREGRCDQAVAGRRAGWWRWPATASTTPPRWPRPTWGWPWAPALTWPSRQPI